MRSLKTEEKEKSLAAELRISSDEIKKTAERLKYMKQAAETVMDPTVIDRIFNEWMEIARRLRKGGQMLDRVEDEQKYVQVKNLYTFLLIQLGVYDEFFRMNINEAHYKGLQKAILKILNDPN